MKVRYAPFGAGTELTGLSAHGQPPQGNGNAAAARIGSRGISEAELERAMSRLDARDQPTALTMQATDRSTQGGTTTGQPAWGVAQERALGAIDRVLRSRARQAWLEAEIRNLKRHEKIEYMQRFSPVFATSAAVMR